MTSNIPDLSVLSSAMTTKTSAQLRDERTYTREKMGKIRRQNNRDMATESSKQALVETIQTEYGDEFDVEVTSASKQEVKVSLKKERRHKHGPGNLLDGPDVAMKNLPELMMLYLSFETMTTEDTQKMATVKIINGEKSGQGSVNDPAMGGASIDSPCSTCTIENCPSHYGIIEFAEPIPNPRALSTSLIKVLECICTTCGRLKLSDAKIEALGIDKLPYPKRLAVLSAESKKQVCDRDTDLADGTRRRCRGINPIYKVNESKDEGHIKYQLKSSDKVEIMAISRVIEAFSLITTRAANLMGFPRKESPMTFIMTHMLVPPPSIRPPVFINGEAKTSDMTEMLMNISKKNMELKKAIDSFNANNKNLTYVNGDLVCNVLQCICLNCYKLKLGNQLMQQYHAIHGTQQLFYEKIKTMASYSNIPCENCNTPTSYTFKNVDNKEIVYTTVGSQIKTTLQKDDILNIFSTLKDEDVVTLGISSRRELTDIAAMNSPSSYSYTDTKVKDEKAISVMSSRNELYKAVSIFFTYIDSLITGKEELIREMMMAKRSDYCGRAVISPYDDIKLGEIVIPEYIAKQLAKKVTVNEGNIGYLRSLMSKGRITYVQPAVGSGRSPWSYSPTSIRKTIEIEIGDEVERWLQTGDMILAGRQPTIHKYNIMAYKVVVKRNRSTIGKVLSVTGAINGDFDGDEMSLFLPQSDDAVTEAFERMYVCRNLISQANSTPIIAPSMDTITYVLRMTNPGSTIRSDLLTDAHVKLNMFNQLQSLIVRLDRYQIKTTNGRALFSSILPADFIYNNGSVSIIDGILVKGRLTGSMLGKGHRSIVQDLFNYYGWEVASKFITDVVRIARMYADDNLLSVGYSHCDYGDSQVARLIKSRELALAYAEISKFGPSTGNAAEERSRETKIKGVLSTVKGVGIELSTLAMDRENAIRDMSKDVGGGAKGGPSNTNMMGGVLGQQYLEGGRILPSMDNGTRTTIYSKPGSDTPMERGFCESNFSSGLNPIEKVNHAKATRAQLIDTPLNVGPVGDLHRKIAKGMENTHIYHDMSVRNFDGDLFQMVYGEDGLDSSKLMNVTTDSGRTVSTFIDLKVIANRINRSFGWVPKVDIYVENKVNEQQELDKIKQYYDQLMGEYLNGEIYDATPYEVDSTLIAPTYDR